jgi:cold shock CspA family protein
MAVEAFGTGSGEVVAFDDFAGWGTVREADGSERFFHCTRIADGSRHVDVGEHVTFALAPVGLGTWEAVDLRPAPAPARG